jgi:hypothetical protein
MISLRQIAQCIGLSANFSVIRDFYGYRSSPNQPPIQLSLIQQTRLLRDGQHVTIHIKIVTNPTSFSLDRMINAIRQVYGNSGIGVIVRSIENLNLPSDFLDIDVGNCIMGQTTNEQNQLFNNRNNVGANEVVVYFVRSTNPPFNGCAAFPANRPGAIVVRTASQWTLAHEIGHVLGLLHVDASPNCLLDRLMTGCGTFNITNPPPDLVQSEVNTMNNSQLTVTC